MTVSLWLGCWRCKGGWRGTNMISYHWWGRDTRGLAIGWCHETTLRLRLGWGWARWWQMLGCCLWCHSGYLLSSLIRLCCELEWWPQVVEIGTTHNVGSSLRVWLVTFPDQHLTRPCLAECVLAIALGSMVGRVDSLVQVQCIVAFKTYPVELLSAETLVSVLVGSCLWWLTDYVSSWGTTRMDTCILLGNGSVHSSLCHFKTESREVLIWCMWYVSKRKYMYILFI